MEVAKRSANSDMLNVWKMQEETSCIVSFIDWQQFFYAVLFSLLSALCLCTNAFVQQQNSIANSRVGTSLSYVPPLMVKPISVAEEMYGRRPYAKPGVRDLGEVDRQTETTTSSYWDPTDPPATQPPT